MRCQLRAWIIFSEFTQQFVQSLRGDQCFLVIPVPINVLVVTLLWYLHCLKLHVLPLSGSPAMVDAGILCCVHFCIQPISALNTGSTLVFWNARLQWPNKVIVAERLVAVVDTSTMIPLLSSNMIGLYGCCGCRKSAQSRRDRTSIKNMRCNIICFCFRFMLKEKKLSCPENRWLICRNIIEDDVSLMPGKIRKERKINAACEHAAVCTF